MRDRPAALQDLQQFNDFFIEKEEECIIRTQALEEQLARAQPGSHTSKLRSAFVDLHGEASSCLRLACTISACLAMRPC